MTMIINEGTGLVMAGAYNRDVGRNIARLHHLVMDDLGVSNGDPIWLYGRRKTVAIAMEMERADEPNHDIIRCDPVTRENARVKIRETVTVKKVESTTNAGAVRISILDDDILLNESARRILKEKILNGVDGIPFTSGDRFTCPVGVNKRLLIEITSRTSDPFFITARTKITIKKSGGELVEESWEDIGGLDEEIEKLREIVEMPFKYHELFRQVGIKPPKGILLHGPSGTGKTLLARVVASQIDASFFHVNAPEILSKFYGESEERLRQLFEDARKKAPSIVFIDEIDAIAVKRSETRGDVEKRVVAQLLGLMDGLKGMEKVIVIGATNMVDDLDPAFRRAGRFDREIEIGVPDKKGRLDILRIHTRNMPIVTHDDVVTCAINEKEVGG